MVPQPSDFYATQSGRLVHYQSPIPPEVLTLMDAFVNGQRTKVGMPRADVNTLTVSYVIQTLRDCATDDDVTSDYDLRINVGDLNKTGIRIPDSRSDDIKMYTIRTSSPQ